MQKDTTGNTTPKTQHTLNLSDCDELVDVSALRNVHHTLDLSGCDELEDVSALGNVHTLDLSGCDQLVDISALRNVQHTLNYQHSGCRVRLLSGIVPTDAWFDS